MAKCLFQVCFLVFTVAAIGVGQTAVLLAQVLNAPAAQSGVAGPPVGVQQAGGPVTPASVGEVEQAGWTGITMPKITMPKLTMPKVTMPQLTMPSFSSVTSPVKSGFSKVSAGTKKAWDGTKEMFTFGQNNTTATPGARPSSQQKPSFWQRLIAKTPEPQGPQTVGEFMRQPRLDP